jgi:hypothetical protein
MQTRAAAEGSERDMVLDTLDAIDRMGLTVVRTWAFADGEQEWNALQPQPGTPCTGHHLVTCLASGARAIAAFRAAGDLTAGDSPTHAAPP